MPVSKLGKRLFPFFVCAATFTQTQTIFSQELRSLLFSDDAIELGTNSKPVARSPKVETETIRERF